MLVCTQASTKFHSPARPAPCIRLQDVYAFGMLMYEVLAICRPFCATEEERVATQTSALTYKAVVVNGVRPSLQAPQLEGVPFEVKATMRQCWDAAPVKRPLMFAVKRVLTTELQALGVFGSAGREGRLPQKYEDKLTKLQQRAGTAQ